MNTTANANLFSRLFDGLDDPSTARDRTARRQPHQLCRPDRAVPAGSRTRWSRAGSSPATVSRRRPKSRSRRLVLYLATVRAGAVYLPLNTAYTLNELDYFIGDAEPSLVVCDPSKARRHRRRSRPRSAPRSRRSMPTARAR